MKQESKSVQKIAVLPAPSHGNKAMEDALGALVAFFRGWQAMYKTNMVDYVYCDEPGGWGSINHPNAVRVLSGCRSLRAGH